MNLGLQAGSQWAGSADGPEREAGGDGDLGWEGTSQAHVDDDHQSVVVMVVAVAAVVAAVAAAVVVVVVVVEVVDIPEAEGKDEDGELGAARTSTERRWEEEAVGHGGTK